MSEQDQKNLTIDDIRNKIAQGASVRETGDYELGEKELKQAFDSAEKMFDPTLAMEAGNQLSIQYRLIAGRSGRAGNLVQAEQYATKSLKIYDHLEQQGLLDSQDPITIRNRSHAQLYAGFVGEAIPALQHSAEIQPNPASQGDEYCHLASAYFAAGNIQQAQSAITKGLELLKNNNGSLIALTYGLMTEASILSKSERSGEAIERLKQALQIAEVNSLAVRKEEIEFLLGKPAVEINILEAVSGNLKEIRDLEKEISSAWKKPEIVPEKPIVLLLGGFQGSGKSSILRELRDNLGLIIVSADEMRQNLFDKGYPFSNRFTQIVEATVASLFRIAMSKGYSVASDSNMTPGKIQAFREFVTHEGFSNFHIITAFLELSAETLRDRVGNRTPIPGRYTGKVDELEASMQKHGQIDNSYYDLVLDGEKLTIEQESQLISDKIQQIS